MRNGLSH